MGVYTSTTCSITGAKFFIVQASLRKNLKVAEVDSETQEMVNNKDKFYTYPASTENTKTHNFIIAIHYKRTSHSLEVKDSRRPSRIKRKKSLEKDCRKKFEVPFRFVKHRVVFS